MIYIALIFILNAMGVSYAVWSDNAVIDFSLSTGFIEPNFELVNTSANNQLNLKLLNDKTLKISGTCYESVDEDILLRISNIGTIPIRKERVWEEENDGVYVDIKAPEYIKRKGNGVLDINVNIATDSVIYLEAEEEVDEFKENYDFEYILQYQQGIGIR